MIIQKGTKNLVEGKKTSGNRKLPLLEGLGIDLDDGVFDQGLSSDHLVGHGIVHNIHDTDLARRVLGSPSVVTGVPSQSTELLVGTCPFVFYLL